MLLIPCMYSCFESDYTFSINPLLHVHLNNYFFPWQTEDCESAYFKMDNVLIDDRRIHVDFSQSVSKLKWKGSSYLSTGPPLQDTLYKYYLTFQNMQCYEDYIIFPLFYKCNFLSVVYVFLYYIYYISLHYIYYISLYYI